MSKILVTFNIDGQGATCLAAADITETIATTLVVFPEGDPGQGLTGGEYAVKHNVPLGTEAGTYSL